jgi:phosphorylcholine metabolism protein LicD
MNIYKIRESFIGISNRLGIYSLARHIWLTFFKKAASNYEASIFHENAEKTLITLSKALDENNIKAWLVYGTLLGYVREKDFISYDYDIDLGVFHNKKNLNLENILIKYGFKKIREFQIDDGIYGLEQTYELNGVTVDFFYNIDNGGEFLAHTFYSEETYSMNQTIERNGGLLVTEFTFTPYELERIKFKGGYFYIPKNPDLYLKEYYGEDYMIPNKNWKTGMAKNSRPLEKVGVRTLFLR